jgi:hypothetical protein
LGKVVLEELEEQRSRGREEHLWNICLGHRREKVKR